MGGGARGGEDLRRPARLLHFRLSFFQAWGERVHAGLELEVQADVVVGKLSHIRLVDTHDLCLLVHTQTEAGYIVHDPEDDCLLRRM